MSAILMTATARQLTKWAENPLTRDEALAEIERRNAVSVSLSNAAKAEATKVIHALMGEVTTREVAVAYVSIKAPKWYGVEELPTPLATLKSALATYLRAENVSLEANAMKAYLDNN
jgi:hypothetical protein